MPGGTARAAACPGLETATLGLGILRLFQRKFARSTPLAARRWRLAVEPLEERALLTGPTANQQYLLELINRMRMDPASERELILNAHDAYVDTALYYFDVNLTTLAQQW